MKRKKLFKKVADKPDIGAYMKIFTSYLQVLGAVGTLDLSLP